MITPVATVCLISLWLGSIGVDARVPPKLVKAVNGVGKALYAGRYGYSVVPIPPHISVQANVARKEVHLPTRLRKKRRPPPRRPQYASQYQEYTPSPIKKKLRRPPKQRSKPRPHYREEYYDEEEVEEELDYDYEERPKKRYKEGRKEGNDYDDFVAQHSELYSSGYNPGRKKLKYREEEYYESSPVFVRKPKPVVKSWTGVMRPSSKLYSAAIGAPSRPVLPKEDEEEERPRYRKRRKPQREEEEEYSSEEKEEEYYNPDNIYHDRTYEAKQKRRERGTEEKEPKIKEEPKDWRQEEKPKPTWRPEVREEVDEQPWWTRPEKQETRVLPIMPKDPMEGWRPGENPQELWTQGPVQTFRWIEPSPPPRLPLAPPLPTVQQIFDNPHHTERWPEVQPTPHYETTPKPKAPKKRKQKTQRVRNAYSNENREDIVAQRVVGGVVKWNDEQDKNWQIQGFRQDIQTPQYPDKADPEGEIVYGSRISPNHKMSRKEPDIGFGQGMEVMVDDKVAGWQVY